MEKEKVSRKKSIDVKNLPAAPEIPYESKVPVSPHRKANSVKLENDPFGLLYTFNDREAVFLKSLNESIKMFDSENSFSCDAINAEMSHDVNKRSCEDECHGFIHPLMTRTQESISALLATKDSLDQLDDLHRIIRQLLRVQEQNYHMRKRLRTVKTLHALKSMEIQMNVDPEKFIRSSMEDGSDIDINEIEENMANLEQIIAAGASSVNKRCSSKKQRSKSIISEDFTSLSARENDRNYPLRRQSAISDFKPKVSKWTKVKAAFKWEKTNALPLIESKSSDSILSPNNSELARYLRVPTIPHGCSSGDSLFSASSGRIGTPPEISSAASSADENEDEKTSRNRKFVRETSYHDEDRRSHSLDGELILGPNLLHQLEKGKNKSAWSKVKGIVANRNSRKSVKSTGSTNSRDVSPIDVADMQRDRTDSLSSSNQPSPSHIGVLNLSIPDNDYGATSSGYSYQMSSDDNESKGFDCKQGKANRQGKKGSRKSKHVPEIESLLEGVPLGSSYNKKTVPYPLVLQRDLSESDGFEANNYSPNSTALKSPQLRNATSVPNSPSKACEFFSENDFSSSGDYSECPLKRGSNNSSKSSRQQDEILRNFHELQKKINLEFEKKKIEWEKMRPLVLNLNNSVPTYLKEDSSLPSTPKNIISNITLNEENLSADFKKKLDEWRTKKSQQSVKKQPQQQPDWQLWKTGQMKFENQGLIALPDAKDLPEDFQKKLNEWKQMKTEGRVPAYTHQTSMHERMKRQFSKSDSKSSSSSSSMKKSKTLDEKSEGFSKLKALVTEPINKEIVVKTSKGTMTFQGISRKFTRKLYEWEKAKGIAPESSTFALLHPEYKAMLESDEVKERTREKSPGMKRCLSVDSVKPVPSHADIQLAHQPSSLSLNDAENFKENDSSRRVVSNLEIFKRSKENNETETDEPEAMLVEIEDDTYETVSNATPITQMQIPIFKFDFANRDSRHEPADCIRAIKEIKDVFENANNSILDIYKTNAVSTTGIKHLTNIFKYINHSLIQLRESSKDYSSAFLEEALRVSNDVATDFEQVDNSFSESSLLEKLPNINYKSAQLKDSLLNLETFYVETCATSIESFQAKRTVQNADESQKAVATVKVTPTFVCNSFKVNEVQIVNVPLKASSDSEMPGTSTGDLASEEKISKKVTRNTSNGSKRKVRLRRMGSRQSSKTESDTEDEQANNSDVTRKVKRKTSRAKKQLESDKSFDSFQGEDEVVYVFKIKPGEKNEVSVKPAEALKANVDDSLLASPTENAIQIIEPASINGVSQNLYTNAIVKTKRKIFTPVETADGTVNSSICQEIESSSASDKNDGDKVNQQSSLLPQSDSETYSKISTLPPLPSPKVQRKFELTKQGSSKDLSPSIRLMIDRYTFNIDKKSNSPNSSGSCSPIWRSPILDRRVRKQSTEYQNKLQESNSSHEINEGDKEKHFEDASSDSVFDPEKVSSVNDREQRNDSSTETLIEPRVASESNGAIPKEPKVLESNITVTTPDLQTFSDTVTLRSDSNKPRTPLSERAMKIKQAKEAFLKMPLISSDSSHSNWSYRLSQISIGSTDSNNDAGSLIKCLSAGVLENNNADTGDNTSAEVKSLSLPRNTKGLSNDSETVSESSRGSRFGLSSLATKLRKVKLKRNAKEVKKMNTVSVLCRQSVAVDFSANNNQDSTTAESSQDFSRFRKNKHENVKKSKSLGVLDNE